MTNWPTEKELERVRKKLEKSVSSYVLPKNTSTVDKAKYKICELFVFYIKENNLTQRELAKSISIDEVLVSKIVHYHIDHFTVDKLLEYFSRLFPSINLKLEIS